MTYRVLQWSTGNVGRASLRSVLAHPELELGGVFAHDPAKKGVDAGALLGRDPVGVAVTTDVEEAMALDVDCVLHMPLPSQRYGDDPGRDLDDLCRLLRAGRNVVTTVGYVYPRAHGPEVEERLASACAEGGSSVHGTGTNPGWLAELLPLVMTSLSQRIDRIRVVESTEFSFYPSREVIFEMMGFGMSPEDFEASSERYVEWLSGLFRESLWMLADGLALEIEDETRSVELERATAPFDIAAGRVEAGTIAGQRFRWAGRAGGEDRIVFEAIYRANPRDRPGMDRARLHGGGAGPAPHRPSTWASRGSRTRWWRRRCTPSTRSPTSAARSPASAPSSICRWSSVGTPSTAPDR